MEKFDAAQFKSLAESGRDAEAEKYLADFFKQALTPAERGEALVALASLYIEAENSRNRQYLEYLEGAIEMLKSLEKQEKKLEDQIDLDLARQQIAKN